MPTFNLDLLEAGIRKNAEFVMSIGYQFDVGSDNGPLSPTAIAFMQDYLDSDLTDFELFMAFLAAIGPDLVQKIVVPGPLGLQFFDVLCQPQTKDECKNDGWQQFNVPPPGLGFKNQGQCIAFFNTGMFVGTTAALAR